MILAHGRDPNFPGWPDTLQLNYGNPELQLAMIAQLERIATMCDGVRCDMAMLVLPDVYRRTWNIEIDPFWKRAISAARAVSEDFVFMAEVYWGLEWELQQLGFDYTYDKELYDRLRAGDAARVRGHLTASPDYQRRSVRFLENHDEPRAAEVFDREKHKAAAMITYFVRGLRFFHDGQLEGVHRRSSVHLRRRFTEAADTDLVEFYSALLSLLRESTFQGSWTMLDSPDTVIAFSWRADGQDTVLAAVNYTQHASKARVRLPSDIINPNRWKRLMASDSANPGNVHSNAIEGWLELDLPPWGYRVFRLAELS
jgi:glycosidase